VIAKGLATLALLLATQASDAPAEGPISFSVDSAFGGFTQKYRFRIDPDGVLVVEASQVATGSGEAPETRSVRRDTSFSGYRRIAALLAPLRRWKDEVPCRSAAERAKPDPLAGTLGDVIATVRWEAENVAVKVPITCPGGPAQNEIELARAAMDQVREWAREDSGITENGPSNSVEMNVAGEGAD
jgi:hypothetical protein